jgi:CubicO group peptidase (beta-lactamase class C family)
LLGEIVATISGQTYDEYIQQNILRPLQLADTRTELPEDLYGSELAIGYSAPTREGKRYKVKMFQANGIKPAAGFSSNVLDLGKFASWQFRLYDTSATEILKPSTLKYMHNVHWTNPDWNTTWGLGFSVYKGSDGSRWVSHGGSCPGYRSTLQIHPKSKRALSVIINGSGTNPNKYSKGINALLNKVKKKKDTESDKSPINLNSYTGFYDAQPWGSESYVAPWEGKIAILSLPSSDPADDIELYQHIEGDTFRRIRNDDELGETLTFFRDNSGKVTRFSSHGNFRNKME